MGVQQRREREKQQRRKDILSAARSLFWKKGYDGTTMPAIARAAELAPGTLYLYFSNKDSLYVELLLEGYELMQRQLQQAVETETEPARRGEALIEAFFQFAHECPEYFDIIFFVIQKEHSGWEETFDTQQLLRLEARLNACKQIAADALRALGGLNSEAELTRTVDAVWTMLAGVVFFFRRKKGQETFHGMTSEAKRIIIKGLIQ